MPTPHQRPSIKDVAELAGVSWKTVTNVMHQRPNVRPATRERVLAAVQQLGYRPNRLARQLQEGRSRVLALAIPDITSSYFGALAARIISLAGEDGWLVVIQETQGDAELEEQVISGSDLYDADGLILVPTSLDPERLHEAASKQPIVAIGQREDPPGPNHVAIDNIASARVATQHMLDRGRQRLAFLGGSNRGHGTGWLRQTGFLDSLAAAGVEPVRLIEVDQYDRRSAVAAMSEALATELPIDGLVCAVDALALGAMHALRRAGRVVPDDVAVLGWDNIEDGEFANPTLTTIAPDVDAVAHAAVSGVLQRIEQPVLDHLDTVHVPYRLIIRESTG